MNFFRRASIKRKQTLIIMATSGAALLLAFLAFTIYEIASFRRATIAEVSMLSELVGNASTAALDFNDHKSAQETLSALKAEPDVVHGAIYDKAGEVFVVYERTKRPGFTPPPLRPAGFQFSHGTIQFFQPISSQGEVIGTIYIERDLRALDSRLRQYLLISAGVFSAAVLLAFGLSAWLQRFVSGPIVRLVETARQVARERNYSVRAVRHTDDELGVLVDSFNEMLAQIQLRDAELQKAKESLEMRVEERTTELQQRSEELRQEIIQHKRTEEALAASERLMVSLVETLPQNVLRKDLQGRFTFVNGVFCRTAGKLKDEIIGQTDWSLYPAELAEKFRRDDELVISTGKPFETEEEHQGPNGSRFYVQVIKTPLYDSQNNPVGIQIIFWDVSARRAAEQALRAQEERTRLIIDQAFDAVFTTDVEGKLIAWNRQAQTTFGWSPEEVLGRKVTDVIVPERNRRERENDYEELRRTGKWRLQGELLQTTGLCRDGTEVPLEVSSTAIAVGKGHILNIFARDISARRMAEAELAYERDLLKTLMEHAPDVIYFKDLRSRFVRISKSFAALFSVNRPEFARGKTDFDFFTEEHARAAYNDEQEIIRTGKPVLGKIEKETHVDGRITWALTSKMPWRDGSGNIIGTFGISQNITSMKEAEAKLEAVHKELLSASRLAGMAEVATSVLHNVGNVLNSVNVTVTVLEDQVRKSRVASLARLSTLLSQHAADLSSFLTSDSRGRRVPEFISQLASALTTEQGLLLSELESLRKNVGHIKEIVGMQQSYARVSGLSEMVDVAHLVEDTLSMNAASFENSGLEFVRDFSEVPPINTDKHKVLQILINLIRNAKFACRESGRPDKRIVVRVSEADGRVRISVEDNGIGIPAENLTRIFNHGFTTRKDGHGFGLHSGALAAKELGGSLVAHSAGTGKGAVFTLELPRSQRG
ncbi:MAG TPA: PAS domain S-box protein [Verrucomicrobiae bacterium]|nr:PAS domain S-box protein [Verrucomicrobiae bacterium]